MKYTIAFIILFILVSFSCSPGDPHRDPGTVIMGLEAGIQDLDPRTATDANSSRICSLIYSGLFKKDRSSNIVPDIISHYEMEDEKTYIFHIRDGIYFHNGGQLTSADVKYTYESLLEPDFISFKKASYEIIDEISIIDDLTISFRLKEVFSPFIDYLTLGIIPKGIDAHNKDILKKNPVGTGPFEFVRHREGIMLTLSRFDNYFDNKPEIIEIIFRIIPDTTTRLLELENKGIDILQNDIPYDSINRFKQNPDYILSSNQGINYQYIGFNMEDEVLRINDIRKAIALSIDRDIIIEHIFKGYVRKANSLLSPLNWAYCENLKAYEYDPERAIELIENSGFQKDRDGFYFTLEYKTSENIQSITIAQIIQDQLRKAGIRVNISSREWGTFYDDIRKGDFQIFSLRWVGISDPDIYYYIMSSDSFPPNGANRGRYSNPEVDDLIHKARRTTERDERKELYCKIQKILNEELPYIHLWYHSNIIITTDRVKNAQPYPDGSFHFLFDITVDDRI